MNPSKSRTAVRKLCMIVAVFGLASSLLAYGQDNPKPARLTFDIASIKPSKPGGAGGGIKAMPGGEEYVAQNAPVILMISLMFKVPIRQISGAPDWVNNDLYEVDAKADHPYNIDDLHTMFQNLLVDEFKMQFHKETREGPVYALTVDKSGLKMKVNDTPQDFEIPIKASPDGVFTGKRVPMQYLCWWLSQNALRANPRPVIDLTGLDKLYDFQLTFLPELPPNFPTENLPPGFLDRPSIFDALRVQLGLKLEPQKGPVEYFVIDHIEKPAAN
ncbi:MAG TPA: TIGR03435 family protein [Candidatus Acidoferrales bacterium]|jgi:uncharacterized protein (TIGR03435 family)|nr:TIGR03435 family protein [Candidatus Acidoferrales bacterium]